MAGRARPVVLLGSLIVVACAISARSQSIVVTRTAPNPIANFDISYIDITGRGAGPMLFQLMIDLPDTVFTYYVRFTATWQGSGVNGWLQVSESGRYRCRAVGPRPPLTSNVFFTDMGPDSLSLHSTTRRMDDPLRSALLTTGFIPPGRVTLDFELFQQGGGRVYADQTYFEIVAVRYVKLVTPGVDASASVDKVPESFTAFPQFVWASDLMPINYPPGTVKFVIAVYENPDNTYSPADIPDTRPLWIDTVPGESSVNYAQYPVSGARALTPDQVYYWQAKAVLQGPVSREIASELFAFKVADLDMVGTLSPTQNMILKYLAMILGSNYAYVMRELRELAPQEEFLLNGKAIGIEGLAGIAEDFVLGQRSVARVEVE